jgi:hypothetical protein
VPWKYWEQRPPERENGSMSWRRVTSQPRRRASADAVGASAPRETCRRWHASARHAQRVRGAGRHDSRDPVLARPGRLGPWRRVALITSPRYKLGMAKLYDRTVAELMADAAADLQYPARRGDVVAWFAERYPGFKASTVRAHITGLTDNDRNRHHYAWLASREPLFNRTPDGSLIRYEPPTARVDKPEDPEATEQTLEFALEAFLEQFLLTNWENIDWGRPLELWESDAGELGHQLVTPVGRLDFLCRDPSTDTFVVIELKRGRPSDRVVGQAARYMGWVRAHLARDGQSVEGLIVAHEQELRLAYAVSAVPGLSVLTYSIDFTLSVADIPGGPSKARAGTT